MRVQSRDTQATCIPSRFPFFGNPVPRFLPSDPNPVKEEKRRQKRTSHIRLFRHFEYSSRSRFFFSNKIDLHDWSEISPFFSPLAGGDFNWKGVEFVDSLARILIEVNEWRWRGIFFFFFRCWGKGDKSWFRIDEAYSTYGERQLQTIRNNEW